MRSSDRDALLGAEQHVASMDELLGQIWDNPS
jgi:hypothetical protein